MWVAFLFLYAVGVCVGVWGFGLGLVVRESFVARVVRDGKVTIPSRIRNLLNIGEGDYVRLSLYEVIRTRDDKKRGRV